MKDIVVSFGEGFMSKITAKKIGKMTSDIILGMLITCAAKKSGKFLKSVGGAVVGAVSDVKEKYSTKKVS